MTSQQWLLAWDIGTFAVYAVAGVAVLLQLLVRRLLRDNRQYRPRPERSASIERLRAESGYDPSLRRGQR